eukprot:20830-Pelagomonas_calceolata.AAC.1
MQSRAVHQEPQHWQLCKNASTSHLQHVNTQELEHTGGPYPLFCLSVGEELLKDIASASLGIERIWQKRGDKESRKRGSRHRKARHHGSSTWTKAQKDFCTVHPKVHNLFVSTYKLLQMEDCISDETTGQPFLKSTKVPHILEMRWHNVRKLCRCN